MADYNVFDKNSAERIGRTVRAFETQNDLPGKNSIPRNPYYGTLAEDEMLVQIIEHLGNGEYQAKEVVLDNVGSTFVTPDGYLTFGATGATADPRPYAIIETNRSQFVSVGDIVKIASKGTADGETRWFFESPGTPQTLTAVVGVQLGAGNILQVQTRDFYAIGLQDASSWTSVSGWNVTGCV